MDAPRRSGLRLYDAYQGPQPLGTMWTRTKADTTLRCTLATHRLGWELRVLAGETFLRSQVCKTEPDVFRVSQEWEQEAKDKGWSSPADEDV